VSCTDGGDQSGTRDADYMGLVLCFDFQLNPKLMCLSQILRVFKVNRHDDLGGNDMKKATNSPSVDSASCGEI